MCLNMEKYSTMSDNDLIALARKGDRVAEEQLALRYTRLVKVCSRPYFLVGGAGEDLIQEGMLGLLSAIREYDPSLNATFKTYAEVCVKRRIYSAIKTASRKKHEPLNDMVSFDDVLSDEKLSAAASYGEAYRRSPEEQVLARESAEEIIQTYSRCLSKFETEILKLYLNGSSYSEIAEACGKTEKSVDNAVQRIRRKLARSLSPSDNSDSCSQNRCPQG